MVSHHTSQNSTSKKSTNKSAEKDVENRELPLLVGMQIDNGHYGKQDGGKKLGIKLPYSQAIPLLGIYPEEKLLKKTHVAQCSQRHYLQ